MYGAPSSATASYQLKQQQARCLVALGAFYVLNLFLALLIDSFVRHDEESSEKTAATE